MLFSLRTDTKYVWRKQMVAKKAKYRIALISITLLITQTLLFTLF